MCIVIKIPGGYAKINEQQQNPAIIESYSFGGRLGSVLFISLATSLDHILGSFYLDKSLDPPGSLPVWSELTLLPKGASLQANLVMWSLQNLCWVSPHLQLVAGLGELLRESLVETELLEILTWSLLFLIKISAFRWHRTEVENQ